MLNKLTYDEVVPPPLPDDLLHALLVRRGDPVTDHKNEDELDIVAEVGKCSKEPKPSIRKPESQSQLRQSKPNAWN